MNNQESLEFIRTYFDELFNKRNPNALDDFLDKEYFDDDIGDPAIDHIKNSKDFLSELFSKRPTIGVDVRDAMTQDNVISAFLEWFVTEDDQKKIIRKGIAIFMLRGRKILRRHTYVYFEN